MTHAPSERLAQTISDALVDDGLVRPARRAELAQRLAEGRITQQEWWAWIAEALPSGVDG